LGSSESGPGRRYRLGVEDYLTQVEHALDDTEFVEVSQRCLDAANWEPDDPRIEELATVLTDHFLANPGLLAILTSIQGRTDDSDVRYRIISDYGNDHAPAWAKLTDVVETKLRSASAPIPKR
jgi:hypothetical protein